MNKGEKNSVKINKYERKISMEPRQVYSGEGRQEGNSGEGNKGEKNYTEIEIE